jgi:hypothetical protein
MQRGNVLQIWRRSCWVNEIIQSIFTSNLETSKQDKVEVHAPLIERISTSLQYRHEDTSGGNELIFKNKLKLS